MILRRILAAAAAMLLVGGAHATQYPYPTMSGLIDSQLPTNSAGTISAAALRGVLHNMLDSVPVTDAIYPSTIVASTYTYQTLDQASNYSFTAATPAITLQKPVPTIGATATEIARGWWTIVTAGPASTITVTSTGSTINGQSSITIPASGSDIISTDGVNYTAIPLGLASAGSGTVNVGTRGQVAAYSASGTSVGGVPTCAPIEAFGGVGDGATDNTPAWTAFKTQTGASTACLAFGPGKYIFNSSNLAWTLACNQYLTLRGLGGHISQAIFPNAGNGFNFIYGTSCGYLNNSVASAYDLGILTGVAAGGSAILINGHSVAGQPMNQTKFEGVFLGTTNAGTGYWTVGFNITDVQNLNLSNDEWRACGGCVLGTPVSYFGSSSAAFPTEATISHLDAEFGATCISAAGWMQGVIITDPVCTAFNFGVVASGTGQLQNEVSIIGGQLDVINEAISLTNMTTNSITGVQIATNRASSVGTSAAIVLAGTSLTTVSNNTVYGFAAGAQAQTGVICVTGTFSVCTNNMINNNIFSGYVTSMVTDATATGNYFTYNRTASGASINLNGASGNTNVGN